jgi:hypothetical protein
MSNLFARPCGRARLAGIAADDDLREKPPNVRPPVTTGAGAATRLRVGETTAKHIRARHSSVLYGCAAPVFPIPGGDAPVVCVNDGAHPDELNQDELNTSG